MIIRITDHIAGVEKYLIEGEKKGRAFHRDEGDKRVPVCGDLAVFSAVQHYIEKHKKWKKSYWHITVSPSWRHHDLSSHRWRRVALDILEHYFHLYERNRLGVYAEIHYPKLQSGADLETQERKQRLPHMHLIVSKLDLWSDNQLRILPYKKSVAAEFQNWLQFQYLDETNPIWNPKVKIALKKLREYREWHREHNHVDIGHTPYAPQTLLPMLGDHDKPRSIGNSIKKPTRNQAVPPKQDAIGEQADTLAGFRKTLEDVALWYAAKPTVDRLNAEVSLTALLGAAERDFGLLAENYQVEGRCLVDQRTGRRDNAVYFAHQILNLNMEETIRWLEGIEAQPDEEESESPGLN